MPGFEGDSTQLMTIIMTIIAIIIIIIKVIIITNYHNHRFIVCVSLSTFPAYLVCTRDTCCSAFSSSWRTDKTKPKWMKSTPSCLSLLLVSLFLSFFPSVFLFIYIYILTALHRHICRHGRTAVSRSSDKQTTQDLKQTPHNNTQTNLVINSTLYLLCYVTFPYFHPLQHAVRFRTLPETQTTIILRK